MTTTASTTAATAAPVPPLTRRHRDSSSTGHNSNEDNNNPGNVSSSEDGSALVEESVTIQPEDEDEEDHEPSNNHNSNNNHNFSSAAVSALTANTFYGGAGTASAAASGSSLGSAAGAVSTMLCPIDESHNNNNNNQNTEPVPLPPRPPPSSSSVPRRKRGGPGANNNDNDNVDHHHHHKLDNDDHESRSSLEDDPLYIRECEARQKVIRNPIVLLALNMASTCIIFMFFLVSMEMILSVGLTVGFTILFYQKLLSNELDYNTSSMNLILLTFTVVTPIMAIVSLAYRRRDEALYAVSDLRATLQQLYMSHALWDWGQSPGILNDSGRIRSTVNWLEHSDQAATEIFRLSHDLARSLTLPNSSRARHRVTPLGRKEASRTNAVGAELFTSALLHLGRLSALCEVMKREGLPPNEATRVRQWERLVQVDMEKIRMVKLYRTPQALRSFGRLFSVALPPFFSPLYAEMSLNLESLAFGLIFAVVTSVALTGLFETVSQFEDPFVSTSRLDGIKVHEELVEGLTQQILRLRTLYYPTAPEFRKCPTDNELCHAQLTKSVFSARLVTDG